MERRIEPETLPRRPLPTSLHQEPQHAAREGGERVAGAAEGRRLVDAALDPVPALRWQEV
jgi:hypothetical protein